LGDLGRAAEQALSRLIPRLDEGKRIALLEIANGSEQPLEKLVELEDWLRRHGY
jgi:hypothetical protein